MKFCPVCNESFTDEFSFCEIDGTKLKRQGGSAAGPAAKKDWSLLGLALVLGAVLITVATILFAPKARFSASTTNLDTVAVAPPQQTAPSTPAVIDTTPSGASDTPPASGFEESLPGTETKKKEKVVKPETDEAAASAKAAAADGDANSKAAKAAVQPAEQPTAKAPAKPEPAVSETKEAEARPRTVTPPVETKETKKQTADSKPADKETDTKKKEEKKKKGGFFGVFKKIFGKDK